DPHRVADLGDLAGGHRAAVASLADAGRGLALEHRADRDGDDRALVGVLLPGLDQIGQLRAVDLGALLHDHPSTLGLDVPRSDPADQIGVDVAGGPQLPGLGIDLQLGHWALDERLGAAVIGADDHVLGHVDQPAGQVARVR